MVPPYKTHTLPPPVTPDRDSSPELGSPSKRTQYNKETGRPIRTTAGKVAKVAGYVDSSMLAEVDSEPLTSEDSEDEDIGHRGRASKVKRKRKRSPSPPSPSLDAMIYHQELDDLTDADESSGAVAHNSPNNPPVTLQFNVPLGFHGPLFVKLDSALLKDNEDGMRHDMHQVKKKKIQRASSPLPKAAATGCSIGFVDLPPELRNSVYRHLFVRNEILRIPQRSGCPGLCQSAQFLRTCKLVHDEGCSILYGENMFLFDRHHDTRAPFWEPKHREIGYQDVLHFLKMIGPENLQYLRDIRIDFEDALPKNTPDLNVESRRYIMDEYLLNCLRILRDAKLRRISLQFFGRRQLFKSDTKFLSYLEQLKADEVVKMATLWPNSTKIAHWVWTDVKAQMTRRKKLYEKK